MARIKIRKMKILYFYQYFSTSEGAWGTRVYEFAKRWVEQGHSVTVVSSIYAKSDLKSNRLVSDQLIEGIHVKVINVRIDNRQSIIKRIGTFVLYAVISSWYALTLSADVVIASSGPITVGIPGLIGRWLRRRKLVFEARDLWPEGAVKMGLLRHAGLIKFCYWFEKICYKNSELIIGLSPGIRDDIKKRFPYANVESVTNAANIPLFSKKIEFHNQQILTRSYALYFGNIGQVNHSEYLLEAARLLLKSGRNDLKVVFIGEGQLKATLEETALKDKLTNVVFLDLMPKSALVSYVQHALASIVPLKPIPVFDTSSPNKLFESMAAGVPVIQTTQGWIKDFLAKHEAGFTVDGNVPQQLADLLIRLKDDKELARVTGEKAAAVARKYFDKDYLADQMLDLIGKVNA